MAIERRLPRQGNFLIGIGEVVRFGRGKPIVDLGGGDWPAKAIALQRMHAGGADLELVERETPQIEKARISSAKIIKRKRHANAFWHKADIYQAHNCSGLTSIRPVQKLTTSKQWMA